MDISELKKKTVLILGAGKSGLASAKFLLDKANKILISENQNLNENIKDKIKSLTNNGVETEFGKNSIEFTRKADLVIISPGISPQSEIVRNLNKENKIIISDIELAAYFIKEPIIAVTGTNGKTTTTSLITHLINCTGKKAVSCGNIGNPIAELIEQKDIDYYVLEISSFQIYYSPRLSPDISICLNITPDHLDWHGSFENYIEAKRKLFLQQKENSWAVLNYNDRLLNSLKTKNNVYYFASNTQNKLNEFNHLAFFEGGYLKIKEKDVIQEIINHKELKILGLHNIENALASIAVLKIINADNHIIKDSLKKFTGVEHRLEHVKKIAGKDFYNDSKATNPEATIKAVEAFPDKKITLILGGRDKNTCLNNMVSIIKKQVSEVILYGEAKNRFKEELEKSNYKEIKSADRLEEAIETSLKSKTDIVLFSPACSSFDMFKNYEERGKTFKEFVSKLKIS